MDLITMGWLLFNTAIGGAICFYLVSNRKTLDVRKKLYCFFAIFTVLHQIEEYVYPGGFAFIFNVINDPMAANLASYPLSPLSTMITNGGALLLFVYILWKFSERGWAILFIIFFSIAQIMLHLRFAMVSIDLYGSAGQTIPYSPGLFTSLVFYLPISVYSIVYLIKNKSSVLNNMTQIVTTIAIAVLVMILTVGAIVVPQKAFGDPDASLIFKGRGYYDSFLNDNVKVRAK